LEEVDVLIIGAGISGIGMGCRLRMHNPDKRFVILEGRDAIGGTWDLFRYPGVRSDSDMYTFGYDFRPWPEPLDIAPGEAIRRYLEETVDEYGLRERIRFGHRVTRLSWSSEDRRWTAQVTRAEDGAQLEISCAFLVSCTGYYNYEEGYRPHFEGEEDFQGQILHPQGWPEDLDYTGKRVVIIGSGATAITLVPAMAKTAAHVTMLQRSPAYIFDRPAEDRWALALKRVLPERAAFRLTRAKKITQQWFFYNLARAWPQGVRRFLKQMARDGVGPEVDVETHFNPAYEPWDQRLCLTTDGDLYEALRSGAASVVTDTIERFTPEGVATRSGEVLEADIIVTATGLQLQFLGGADLELDGRAVSPSELVTYRGMMFANVPNWVAIVGYSAASWTLKADLTAGYVCRLLRHMDERGYDTATPVLADPEMPTAPIMTKLKAAGYVRRAADDIPREGRALPWTNPDSYARDYVNIKYARMEDGVMQFTRSGDAPGPRFLFRDKTAVITGAASGIGAALADALSARGCHLALLDVNEEGLEAVAERARARGVAVTTYLLDVGDPAAVEAFPETLLADHPRIDLLINNAGVALAGSFEQASRADFEWLMGVNFFGVVNMTRALLPLLRQRPDAHIVNLSSIFGIVAPPGQSAYVASKFAVRGFSEVLRRELRDSTVGISVVHPGGVQTGIARSARVAEGLDIEPDKLDARIKAMERQFTTPPERAAEIILAGVEARRARILVGRDAWLLHWVERFFPTTNVERLGGIFKQK
jgi:monooxygenase